MVLRSRLLLACGGLLLAASLAGCAEYTPAERLAVTKPEGTAFNRALYANYAALARSLNIRALPGTAAFDAETAYSLIGISPAVAETATAYAQKAEAAARDEEVLPEDAPTNDAEAERTRLELLHLLGQGRTKAPREAARAQAQFDCWMMALGVPELSAAVKACHRAFLADLAHLRAIPAVTAEPEPVKPKPEPKPDEDDGE